MDDPMDQSQRSETTTHRADQGSMTSQDQGAMPKAPPSASIDPAQVQKVFGSDVTLIDLASLDTEQVKQLQQSLQQRGHYQGAIDGIVGPKTRSGLTALLAQQYSLSQRLVNQGQIPQNLAASLGLDAQGRTPVGGVDMGDAPDQNQQRPNVQSFPAPSEGQQRTTPPSGQQGQQGTTPPPSEPTPPPSEPTPPPSDSRTEDGRMDNYAPVTPR
jgi:hypothetical protein